MYEESKEYKDASKYYYKAHKLLDSNGIYGLKRCYEKSDDENLIEAKEIYKKLCEIGSLKGCKKACENGDLKGCKKTCESGDLKGCKKLCESGELKGCKKLCNSGDLRGCKKFVIVEI